MRIITKPIGEVAVFENENYNYRMYTSEILDTNFVNLPEKFGISLFQKLIEKKFEIRAFFIDGSVFSVAIFSQENEMTKVDFRRYPRKNQNRVVPYKLPFNIEEKICLLMHNLNLNTGSIDFIVDENNIIYFLEINPVGQFGFVAKGLYTDLHRLIANYLKN